MAKGELFGLGRNWIKQKRSFHSTDEIDRLKTELYYFEKLKEAEEKGLTEIFIPSLTDVENEMTGQVFHWIIPNSTKGKHEFDKDEKPIQKLKDDISKKGGLKNYWVAFEMVDNTYTDDTEKVKVDIIHSTGKGYIKEYGGFKFKPVSSYVPTGNIITTNDLNNTIDKEFGGLLKPKCYVISNDGYLGIVSKIEVIKVPNYELTNRNSQLNPHQLEVQDEAIRIVIKFEDEDKRLDGEILFTDKQLYEIEKFKKELNIIEEKDINLFLAKIQKVEEQQSLEPFGENLMLGDGSTSKEQEQADDISRALVGFSSKEHLQTIHTSLAVQSTKVKTINLALRRNLSIEKDKQELKIRKMQAELNKVMEAKKAELAKVHEQLNKALEVFKRKMEKVMRLITTLEIYLGIHENVYQIAEGEPAPDVEPISFRQQVLYMDLEFGDPMIFAEKKPKFDTNGFLIGFDYEGDKYSRNNDGADADNFDVFEKWLIESKSYLKILPEPKCVVVMRPRYSDKYYVENRLINALMNQKNWVSYILIRNGDNIYRIKSEHVNTGSRLFPLRDELQGMFDKLGELSQKKADADNDAALDEIDKEANDLEAHFFQYKKNMLLLQGLVTRTEIFMPLPMGLDILNVNTHKNEDGSDRVRFIYDDENLLTSGRPEFHDWLKSVNKNITKGTRIFLSNPGGGANNWDDRFSIYWRNKGSRDGYGAPPMPYSGVFELKEYKEKMMVPKTEWIPIKQWENEEYKIKKAEVDNKEYTPKYAKHERGLYYVTKTKKINNIEHILVTILDSNGKKIMVEEYTTTLRVAYNPKDEVRREWGRSSGERGTNLTFIIKPEEDDFIVNYDELLLDDVYYYLESRVDRKHYVEMMPLLWGLRDNLETDMKLEAGFADAMAFELSHKYNVDIELAKSTIKDSINWWKNEIVKVWKRPINRNEGKAWRMIKEEAIRRLKKQHKLKIDHTFDNRKNVLVYKLKYEGKYKHREHEATFIGTGLHKHEFVDMIWKHVNDDYEFRYAKIIKKNMKDNIGVSTTEEHIDYANRYNGSVVVLKDGSYSDTIKKQSI